MHKQNAIHLSRSPARQRAIRAQRDLASRQCVLPACGGNRPKEGLLSREPLDSVLAGSTRIQTHRPLLKEFELPAHGQQQIPEDGPFFGLASTDTRTFDSKLGSGHSGTAHGEQTPAVWVSGPSAMDDEPSTAEWRAQANAPRQQSALSRSVSGDSELALPDRAFVRLPALRSTSGTKETLAPAIDMELGDPVGGTGRRTKNKYNYRACTAAGSCPDSTKVFPRGQRWHTPAHFITYALW